MPIWRPFFRPQVAAILFPALSGLQQHFETAAGAGGAGEFCMTLALLAVGAAEALLPALVECEAAGLADPAMAILQTILLATEHPDQAIVDIAIGFWEVLAAAAPPALPWVQQLYSAATLAITRRCLYPPAFTSWDEAAIESGEFWALRRRARSALRSAARVLGPQALQVILGGVVEGASWQQIEGAFFAASCAVLEAAPSPGPPGWRRGIARAHFPPSQAALEALVGFGFGPQAHGLHPLVRHAALKLLAEARHWLRFNPHILETVLARIFAELGDPAVSVVAAETLRSIATACGWRIARVVDVATVVQGVVQATWTTPAARPAAEALTRIIACCPLATAVGGLLRTRCPIPPQQQQQQHNTPRAIFPCDNHRTSPCSLPEGPTRQALGVGLYWWLQRDASHLTFKCFHTFAPFRPGLACSGPIYRR